MELFGVSIFGFPEGCVLSEGEGVVSLWGLCGAFVGQTGFSRTKLGNLSWGTLLDPFWKHLELARRSWMHLEVALVCVLLCHTSTW